MSRRALVLVLPVLLWPAAAAAHKPSDSYLTLGAPDGSGRGEARWDLAVRDLDDALGVDRDGDGDVTWGELRAAAGAIDRYARERLALGTAAGACALSGGTVALVSHSDGAYVALPLYLACPPGAGALSIDYRLFFDRDPSHRGIVHVDGGETVVLSAGQHTRTLEVATAATAAAPASFAGFVREGALHIWEGLDHVLFLLALLLPAVLRRTDGARWIPVPSIRGALVDVGKIVTAFTVAHSLTLSLAALGLLRISARLIEPAIAASVVIAAVNNLRPLFGRDRWVVAFALGLLHGFGFSSVLADVGLPRGHLLPALFGFNAGVELGQLAIVAAFVPLAFFVRRTVSYRRFALLGGSAAIAAISVVWLVERALDVSLFG